MAWMAPSTDAILEETLRAAAELRKAAGQEKYSSKAIEMLSLAGKMEAIESSRLIQSDSNNKIILNK